MNKENKLSVYWLLYFIKESAMNSVLLALSWLLLLVGLVMSIIRLDFISTLTEIMIYYIMFNAIYYLNTVKVLTGNLDLRKFHDAQDELYFVVGFTDEDDMVLSAYVSGFESKILFMMNEFGWLKVHDKTVVRLDVFDAKDLEDSETDFYSERENRIAHDIVYHALLSPEHGQYLNENVKYCNFKPKQQENNVEK